VIKNKGKNMGMFIEVNSVEKNCPVIINLDHVVEVAPLISGGCELSMLHSTGMNSKTTFRVRNEYEEFKQFVMQTVSADDIARRFPKVTKEDAPVVHKVKKNGDLEIPKFGG
jgi:hypothetical protein